MKKFTLFAVAAATMAMTACSSSSSDSKTAEAAQTKETAAPQPVKAAPAMLDSVTILTDDNLFRPDKAPEAYTLLDFNAVWCVPCKKLTPAFHQAAIDFAGKVNFYSVDFEKCKATAEAFNITSVPVVIMLSPDGKVQRFEGLGPFISPEQLKASDPDQTTKIILESITEKINSSL